jgi:hypothetical protein
MTPDSDLSECAVDALAPILLQLPVDDFLKTQLSRASLLPCRDSAPRALCRLLYSLDSLSRDCWFDDLFAMLCAFSSCGDADIRTEFPALAAQFLGRLCVREHRLRVVSLASSLTAGDTTMRSEVSEHLATMSSALDEHERAALILPMATALAGAGGLVIGTLGEDADTEIVVDYCAELLSRSPDVAFGAAFAFSAPAVAVGRERWRRLADAFDAARRSPDTRVQGTSAFVLASFAFEMPSRDLQRAALGMLASGQDVAEGIIANLDSIVGLAVSRKLRLCADVLDRTNSERPH